MITHGLALAWTLLPFTKIAARYAGYSARIHQRCRFFRRHGSDQAVGHCQMKGTLIQPRESHSVHLGQMVSFKSIFKSGCTTKQQSSRNSGKFANFPCLGQLDRTDRSRGNVWVVSATLPEVTKRHLESNGFQAKTMISTQLAKFCRNW